MIMASIACAIAIAISAGVLFACDHYFDQKKACLMRKIRTLQVDLDHTLERCEKLEDQNHRLKTELDRLYNETRKDLRCTVTRIPTT